MTINEIANEDEDVNIDSSHSSFVRQTLKSKRMIDVGLETRRLHHPREPKPNGIFNVRGTTTYFRFWCIRKWIEDTERDVSHRQNNSISNLALGVTHVRHKTQIMSPSTHHVMNHQVYQYHTQRHHISFEYGHSVGSSATCRSSLNELIMWINEF